ncbi:MAG: hypothetical protein MHPDNHAH_02833 [Anaerolineales bacterium]|nr:hypothetical protein [Anaerolineales bacterium]
MLNIFLYLLSVVIAGLFFGVFVGLALRDLRLRRGLNVFIKALIRITSKKLGRLLNPRVDIARVRRDQMFIGLPRDKKAQAVDTQALEATVELKQHLCAKFRNQIEAVYLFGSRARGDYRLDSDLDIGIFLAKSCLCSDAIMKEITHQSSELAFKYGLFVQPRVFRWSSLRASSEDSEKLLSQIVVSYGIPV